MFKNKYHIILCSNSPRRKELLAGLGISFDTFVIPGIDESFPDTLPVSDIAEYISSKKAEAYKSIIKPDDLVITADTVVVIGNEVLGKPENLDEARHILRKLSGNTHHVITGVCLTTLEKQRRFSVSTDVTFKQLSDSEIDYYVENYKPLDKAGAYGIQDWIGYIGVTDIRGSYFNVMGLPVQRIYDELQDF